MKTHAKRDSLFGIVRIPGIVGSCFPCLDFQPKHNLFFPNPQLELLKHKYKTFQNTDQRYPWYCSSGPSTANIRTSGYPFYDCTGTVYFALVVEFMGWDRPLDLWDGIPPGISSRRVTAALGRPQKFHRKVPGRSQWDPSRNPQMMVTQRGRRLKILKMSFWRII